MLIMLALLFSLKEGRAEEGKGRRSPYPIAAERRANPSIDTPAVSLKEMQDYLKEVRKRGYKDPFLSEKERRWRRFMERVRTLPRLDGVMVIGGKRVAILDGKVIKEGERIRSFLLKKVEEKGVRLLKDGKEYFVSMKGGEDENQ